MVELTCLNDGKPFKASRKTAKFCSEKCKKAYARKGDGQPATPPVLGTGVDGVAPHVTKTKRFPPLVDISSKRLDPYIERVSKKLGITYEEAAKRLAGFERMGLDKVKWITTGISELDAFQKIPRGRVTQIQGPYAVGKTTLALNMIKGLHDKKVLYVDSEASLNPQLILELGLNDEHFTLYNKSAFIEDIYDVIIKGAKSGDYDLIILDSLAGCTTRTEEANEAAARNIGGKALIVNKLMRIVPMELKNSDTALVIINQEREMIGTYVPVKYTPGGMGPVYAASLILALKTIPSWRFPKDAKNGAYIGHEIEVTVAKSKVSQPHRKAKIKLYYQESIEPLDLVDEPAEEAF